jgi:uncharacterized protein (DUF433 family)
MACYSVFGSSTDPNMATPTKTLRLRPKLKAEIDRIAKRTRRSFSEVAQDLLEEAVRLRQCPGIHFADEASGREAKVSGTGLGVWEVIRDYKAVKGNERQLRKILPHISAARLKAALLYYARFPDEVDAAIDENASLTFETLQVRFPGLVRRA